MTTVDGAEQAVVIQLVYDGPPEAGKTTSVRALARSFGREAYTPEEQNGRTVFFDWLEHTGGRFEGAPICCQIASVPGQDCWLARRLYFIERADAVVFVGDTSGGGWTETVARLRDLRQRLDARSGPPVGIVFQANRRDAPDALPMSVVRAHVASQRIAVVESVALEGIGVREAFVFAVHLALDRVREGQRQGLLAAGSTRAETENILGALREIDLPLLRTSESPRSVRLGVPRAPNRDVASGLIWPPVEGRIILAQAMTHDLEATMAPSGDWVIDLPDGWFAHSAAGALFSEIDRGRAALIDWARVHANAQTLLSPRRCIALAETGDGGYRLWQIRRREPSLRDLFLDDFEPADAPAAARLLGIASRLLLQAKAICAVASFPLPCTLDTVGVSDRDAPVFVGLVPPADQPERAPADAEAVATELASLLRDRPAHERAHVRAAVQYFHPASSSAEEPERVMELLTAMLAS